MIKFFCDIDGLKDNWIAFRDSWSQKEATAISDATKKGWAEYIPILAPKVDSCNLIVGDVVITDIMDVTEEVIEQMDLRLVGFLASSMPEAIARLRTLGNVSARVSSSLPDGKK